MERANPTDEQIEGMRLPDLLKLKGELVANLGSVDAKLRAFYERMSEHFSQKDKKALSTVEKKIAALEFQKAAYEEVEALYPSLKPLTLKRNIEPFRKKFELLFNSYSNHKPLLEFFRKNHANIASLVRDFSDKPFQLFLSSNSCYGSSAVLTSTQAEILTLLPPVQLTILKDAFVWNLQIQLREIIPTMKRVPSLNLQRIPYPDVRHFYTTSQLVTHVLISLDKTEKQHIAELLQCMPQLKTLELQLISDYYDSTSWTDTTSALKNAEKLEEITIDCRWARRLKEGLDVADILANLPAGCKKVTIIEGKLDAATPQLTKRFGTNKLTELKLYKCSTTLRTELLSQNISVYDDRP